MLRRRPSQHQLLPLPRDEAGLAAVFSEPFWSLWLVTLPKLEGSQMEGQGHWVTDRSATRESGGLGVSQDPNWASRWFDGGDVF